MVLGGYESDPSYQHGVKKCELLASTCFTYFGPKGQAFNTMQVDESWWDTAFVGDYKYQPQDTTLASHL